MSIIVFLSLIAYVLSQGQTIDDIPPELVMDCAQLVKHNSIQVNTGFYKKKKKKVGSRAVAGLIFLCVWANYDEFYFIVEKFKNVYLYGDYYYAVQRSQPDTPEGVTPVLH